jgi:branched-chain amino acid transport system substrate-binding protein
MPIGSLNTSETEIAIMGAEAAKAFLLPPLFGKVLTPRQINPHSNNSVSNGSGNEYGHELGGHVQPGTPFCKSAAECGSDHIYPLSTALRGSQFDAPQGRIVLISLISIPGYIRALVWQ